MKKLPLIFAAVILLASCTQDELTETEEFNSVGLQALVPDEPDCSQKFITPSLVEESVCFTWYNVPTRQYSVYATAGYGGAVPYDRNVEIYIVAKIKNKNSAGVTTSTDDAIVDAKIVTIPANQTVSNNVAVFTNAERNYGTDNASGVRVVIANVTGPDGTPETCYLPRMQRPNVTNCYYTLPSNLLKYVTRPNDNDFDNDGIPNDEDEDDDNDGDPDVTDPNDDNDAYSDEFDDDDDNDGIPDSRDPDKN